MKTLTANIVSDGFEKDGKAFISWGDYMWWHLGDIHKAAVELFGDSEVGTLHRDEEGALHFEYSDKVDFKKIGEKIGVRHSGPSVSSSSMPSNKPIKWYNQFKKKNKDFKYNGNS